MWIHTVICFRSFCARCVPPEGCADLGEGRARTPLLSRISRICLEEPRAAEMWQLRCATPYQHTYKLMTIDADKYENADEMIEWASECGPFAEECLYTFERVAVWSRAGRPHLTFTQPSRLLSAHWACFSLLSPFVEERGGGGGGARSAEPTPRTTSCSTQDTTLEKGVLLVEAERLTFFTDAGTEHSAGLPFQVSRVWPLDEGLLIERQRGPVEDQRYVFVRVCYLLTKVVN